MEMVAEGIREYSYIDRLLQIVFSSDRQLGDLRESRQQFLAGALENLNMFISYIASEYSRKSRGSYLDIALPRALTHSLDEGVGHCA
jgi:hypothetical protein